MHGPPWGESFRMEVYMKILQREEKPVLDAINQAWARVLEVLNTKEYADQKRSKYYDMFKEIQDGAEHCNNVSSLLHSGQ